MEIQNSKDWAKVYTAVNFIEKGVCEYANERVYLSAETLQRACATIKGRPVIIDHITGITPENMHEYAVGYVTGSECCFGDSSSFDCNFVVFDDEGKQVIADGYSVSCAYKPLAYGAGGTWHNVPYDREITELEFTHLALVQNPRYEDAKIYENSKDDKEDNMNVEEMFTKMGELIEEKFNACKKNEAEEKEEKEEDDDDKFEMDGETYSKKELVNAFKEKKNAEEKEEKENEEDEEEEEKQNCGDEFFNAMEKTMLQQPTEGDKIEIYTQAKGLERGRKIYGK